MSVRPKAVSTSSDQWVVHNVRGLPPLLWKTTKARTRGENDVHCRTMTALGPHLLRQDTKVFLERLGSEGRRLDDCRIRMDKLDAVRASRAYLSRFSPEGIPYPKEQVLSRDEDLEWAMFEIQEGMAAIMGNPLIPAEFESALREMKPNTRVDKWRSYEAYLASVLRNVSSGLQTLLAEYEQSLGVDISPLATTSTYVCPKCDRIVARGKFKRGTCICGTSFDTVSSATEITVHEPTDAVRWFVCENTWFEEGVAARLRHVGYATYLGKEVLGGSGAPHELDVIAERPKTCTRVFVECKTGQPKLEEVFVLAGKMRDVGISSGMLFHVSQERHPDLARLARSNGIQVFYSVLDRDESFWESLAPDRVST